MGYTVDWEYSGDSSDGEGRQNSISHDLIGYTLGDAVKSAQKKGYVIDNISVSSPPRIKITEYDDSFRVIRVKTLTNNRLTVLVCKPL